MRKQGEVYNLPKWAQSKIVALEASNADLLRKLYAVESGETRMHFMVFGAEDMFLPDDKTIMFQLGKDAYHGVSVRLDKQHECLRIMGSGTLSITPEATNVVRISMEK